MTKLVQILLQLISLRRLFSTAQLVQLCQVSLFSSSCSQKSTGKSCVQSLHWLQWLLLLHLAVLCSRRKSLGPRCCVRQRVVPGCWALFPSSISVFSLCYVAWHQGRLLCEDWQLRLTEAASENSSAAILISSCSRSPLVEQKLHGVVSRKVYSTVMLKGPVKLSDWSALSLILLCQSLTWFQFSKPNPSRLTSVSTQVNALQKDFCYFKMSWLSLWEQGACFSFFFFSF